jgi:hypothetical protein
LIISNAVPKAGGHFLFAYLGECGLDREHGELYADIRVYGSRVMRRPLGGSQKAIWGTRQLRTPENILKDMSTTKVVNAHVHDGVDLEGHKVVFVYRHPRNILVSACRFSLVQFTWDDKTKEPSIQDIRTNLAGHMRSTVARCMAFHGWMFEADVVARFEDLVNPNSGEARKVAERLGLEPKCPTKVLGNNTPWVTESYRGTWSGKHSRWEDVWDKAIDEEWRRLGGHKVEKMYGYQK